MKNIVLVCGFCHEPVNEPAVNRYGTEACPHCERALILQETDVSASYELPVIVA